MFRRKNYYNQNNNKNNVMYFKNQYCTVLYDRIKSLYPNLCINLIQKCIGMIYENPLCIIKELIDNETEFLNTILEAIKVLKDNNCQYDFTLLDDFNYVISVKDKENRKQYLCQLFFEKIKQNFPKFGHFLACKIVGMIAELDCIEIESCLIDKNIFNERCKEALLVLKNINLDEEVEAKVKEQAKTEEELNDISNLELNTLYNIYFLN
jgi:hypothetical protein